MIKIIEKNFSIVQIFYFGPNYCCLATLISFADDVSHIKLSENLIQMTCEANAAGENSSFIFTVGVKSVPLYHFKLACVILHMAVKLFSKPTSKNREVGRFNLESHFLSTLKISCRVKTAYFSIFSSWFPKVL